jgi:SOS-response transcriptional repressor LexA
VAVLLIDGEDAVVKQFFHDPKAKRVTLHSLNPDYMDRVFEGIEITKLRVLGVVKKVIKDI